MISAIVLAAGESRRMGGNKLLLQFGILSVIEHVVSELLKSRVSRVLVVVGHGAGVMRKVLRDYPVTIVENSQYECGMLSSVRAGILALPPETTAFLLALGDQPQIDSALVNRLLEQYKASAAPLLIPTHNGKGGHPVIISTQFREYILRKCDRHGLRELFDRHPESVARIEVPFPAVLHDMDTRQDYERALSDLDSDPIKKQGLRIMREIRAALVAHWDPIGVEGDPDDEYDAYIGPVYRKLRERPSDRALADFLLSIERTEMGLNYRTAEQLLPAARELLKLNVETATIT